MVVSKENDFPFQDKIAQLVAEWRPTIPGHSGSSSENSALGGKRQTLVIVIKCMGFTQYIR